MHLLNDVPYAIFASIRDYCTPLSLDGFPNSTTLSVSFDDNYCETRLPTVMLE